MTLSLHEVLPLAGQLDDAPGFDTGRERFRRFLLELVTDVPTARALIEECQRSVGEQRHRALQDLMVAFGRFLGFAVTFGRYDRAATDREANGRWRSPGSLNVALEIKTEQNASAALEPLALAAMDNAARHDGERSIGLCIVARRYAARGRLDRQLGVHTHAAILRIVSVQSLLTLGEHVSAGRIGHVDIVELLRSNVALDFVTGLLNRLPVDDRPTSPAQDGSEADDRPAFWVATITGDDVTTPEQLLATVIAQRRVLAICDAGEEHGYGSPGDWVCFFVVDRGIVGHAQLASLIADAATLVRQAERFNRVYQLAQLSIYAQPIVDALHATKPFTVAPPTAPFAGSYLAPVAREDFLTLTTYRDDPAATHDTRASTA